MIGSYDKKVCWFDLELSTKPYKSLKYHRMAVRKVVFHPRYPLFATCSDDLGVNIFHSMVYSDLTKNALIVPLKLLKNHSVFDDLGVLDCLFHPIQPWIFSAGADSTIRLYTWTTTTTTTIIINFFLQAKKSSVPNNKFFEVKSLLKSLVNQTLLTCNFFFLLFVSKVYILLRQRSKKKSPKWNMNLM